MRALIEGAGRCVYAGLIVIGATAYFALVISLAEQAAVAAWGWAR